MNEIEHYYLSNVKVLADNSEYLIVKGQNVLPNIDYVFKHGSLWYTLVHEKELYHDLHRLKIKAIHHNEPNTTPLKGLDNLLDWRGYDRHIPKVNDLVSYDFEMDKTERLLLTYEIKYPRINLNMLYYNLQTGDLTERVRIKGGRVEANYKITDIPKEETLDDSYHAE